MSHNVAVVSMEQETMRSGDMLFHANDVIGGRLSEGDLLWPFSTHTVRPSGTSVESLFTEENGTYTRQDASCL
jgi:hypothetical protein